MKHQERYILSTFEDAFFGPKSNVWRPAIYGELMSLISRKLSRNKTRR
jgi:hypothetical protein